MKRFFFTVVAILMASSLYAQDAHLKLKGIPIDGNYKEFAQKLIQKDFKQIDASNDGIVLRGNFMATPGVMVLVYPDPTSKAVSAVSAMIEAGDNWPSIEGKYYDVAKSMVNRQNISRSSQPRSITMITSVRTPCVKGSATTRCSGMLKAVVL